MRRNNLRGFLGIFFMALSVAAMYFWLTYGDEALATKQVVIAKEDIPKGTVIDIEKHFSVVKRDMDSLMSGGLTKNELYQLKGLAADQFIPKNSEVNIKFFARNGMVITNDEVVFKIPNSWIYAVPSSIRRGDDIQFMEVDSNIEKNLNIAASASMDGISTYKSMEKIVIGSEKPVLLSTVLYVKDSSNREVVDADQRLRMDGSSQVSSLEIICTKEEIKVLERCIAKGMKFIIVYG